MIAIATSWGRRAVAWAASLSARERAFAAVFASVLSLAGVTQAFNSVSQARDSALKAQADWRLAEQRHKAFRTPAFVDAAAEAARAARHASMGGDTIHIARARMQAEVEALAAAAGIRDIEAVLQPRPATASAVETSQGVEAITVQLDGGFDASTFVRFVEALSASDRSLIPVSADVAEGADGSRLSVQIRGYALVTEPRA